MDRLRALWVLSGPLAAVAGFLAPKLVEQGGSVLLLVIVAVCAFLSGVTLMLTFLPRPAVRRVDPPSRPEERTDARADT